MAVFLDRGLVPVGLDGWESILLGPLIAGLSKRVVSPFLCERSIRLLFGLVSSQSPSIVSLNRTTFVSKVNGWIGVSSVNSARLNLVGIEHWKIIISILTLRLVLLYLYECDCFSYLAALSLFRYRSNKFYWFVEHNLYTLTCGFETVWIWISHEAWLYSMVAIVEKTFCLYLGCNLPCGVRTRIPCWTQHCVGVRWCKEMSIVCLGIARIVDWPFVVAWCEVIRWCCLLWRVIVSFSSVSYSGTFRSFVRLVCANGWIVECNLFPVYLICLSLGFTIVL